MCAKFFMMASVDTTVVDIIFFFQAEDGIRDLTVTGVQTCALPICFHWVTPVPVAVAGFNYGKYVKMDFPDSITHYEIAGYFLTELPDRLRPYENRSEERRVGKECRSRWSPYH